MSKDAAHGRIPDLVKVGRACLDWVKDTGSACSAVTTGSTKIGVRARSPTARLSTGADAERGGGT